LPLGNIIRKHGITFHCYAEVAYDISKLSKLTECVKDVKYWMTSHFLN